MTDQDTDLTFLRHLIKEIRTTQQRIADESARLIGQAQSLLHNIERQTDTQRSNISAHQPYEFFRSSSSWQIRFDGRLIRVGRHDKGLQYIHKLLMYPGRKFSPSELDPNLTINDEQKLISVGENISVERTYQLQSINPGSENDHLRALKDFAQNASDEQDTLPQRIFHYSQICYLAESLKNIRMLPRYIEAYKSAKEKLDDLVFEFHQECDDKLFVERVLRESGQIRSTARESENTRRKMRERVVKNVQNAIASLDNEAAQVYFKTYLDFGAQSIYRPDAAQPIYWQLNTYE